jgi:hypothetical protein
MEQYGGANKMVLYIYINVALIALFIWYHYTQQSSYIGIKVREGARISKGTFESSFMSYIVYASPFLLFNLYRNKQNLKQILPILLVSVTVGSIWYSGTDGESKITKLITKKLNVPEGSLQESAISFVLFLLPVLLTYLVLLNTLNRRLI